MDEENKKENNGGENMKKKYGAISGAIGGILAVILLAMQGAVPPVAATDAVMMIGAIAVSALIGTIVWDKIRDNLSLGMSSLVVLFTMALISVGLLAAVNADYSNALGITQPAPGPTPEAPAKEAYTIVGVSDPNTSPVSSIGNADVRVLASEPLSGETVTSLTDIENTDSDGSVTVKVSGVYPGTDAWVSTTKSGFYPDKQAVTLTETKSVDEKAELELENIGVLNLRIANADNPDNVNINANNIELDQGAGPFTFDLVVETTNDSVLRDLQYDYEQGSGWSSVSPSLSVEVTEAEGDLDHSIVGDSDLSDGDDSTQKFKGDLEYLKDITIHVEVTDISSTGLIVEGSFNDLFDDEAIHDVSGIAESTLNIEVV